MVMSPLPSLHCLGAEKEEWGPLMESSCGNDTHFFCLVLLWSEAIIRSFPIGTNCFADQKEKQMTRNVIQGLHHMDGKMRNQAIT